MLVRLLDISYDPIEYWWHPLGFIGRNTDDTDGYAM